jgi:hypothetical protein
MRGNWWKIAKLELTLAMKDRESLIWSLVAPIAMAWLFGTMFGSDGPPNRRPSPLTRCKPSSITSKLLRPFLNHRGLTEAPDGIHVVLPDSMPLRMTNGGKLDIRVIQEKRTSPSAGGQCRS